MTAPGRAREPQCTTVSLHPSWKPPRGGCQQVGEISYVSQASCTRAGRGAVSGLVNLPGELIVLFYVENSSEKQHGGINLWLFVVNTF